MPTPSPYELNQTQQRNGARQQKTLHRAIKKVRSGVETALDQGAKAAKLGRKVATLSNSVSDSAQAVFDAPMVWTRWRIFWSLVVLATVMDYMASGHIGEALGQLIAPMLHPLNTETPMASFWIRQLAIMTFVGGMVSSTLAVKFLSSWAANALDTVREATQPGEHLRHWSATVGIGAIHAYKLCHIALMAMFYLYLFGFAREYAIQSAASDKEGEQTSQPPALSVKIGAGSVTTQNETPKSATSEEDASAKTIAENLAAAPKVYYAIVLIIHAVMLFFPTSGFSQARTEARKEKLNERINVVQEDENRTLRDIYETIRIAPADLQQDLVFAAEPVVPKINKLYGHPVIRIAGREENPGHDGASSVPVSPIPNRPTGAGATAAYTVTGDENDTASAEAPNTDWDSIFPSARTA